MAKKASLRPLGDRVVVKPVPRDEKTASGIILPDTAQEKPQEGEVVSVGPGRILDDGKREPIDVKVGIASSTRSTPAPSSSSTVRSTSSSARRTSSRSSNSTALSTTDQ